MPIRNVAVIAIPGVHPFELGVVSEGFGIDRADDGGPYYDFAVIAADDRPVPTSNGWTISTPHRLDRADEADLVIVPACSISPAYDEAVIDTLHRAVDRGAKVMSVCAGAYVLGAAGLLDGRECTTHWRHTDEFSRRFPKAIVNPDVLYVCDGPILTSAGSAAGLDLCLHLIRADYGERVANRVARRMVVQPHRDGGQAQFINAPLRACSAETLAPLLDDLAGELHLEHSIESLASRVSMSGRTFARRFRNETGTTPHAWLTHQRVLLAQQLLESGDDPIETVAARSGFGTAALLRHHFTRVVGTSPAAYRRTFGCRNLVSQ
ncbi:transcriptional regulator GlxA family with amidase domain [Jatrophihabitans sp. GAS493]|uniref:helix-turn-helix domain-containing protein n=1 Tax=Jatrophihabitans sp. GAS493 TaxID=1907575 RepID=UPI000BB74A0E|nr:helix-turn-helix domain-containing protein [Jatrophihabitans sp. GAS493]SOD72831.1 transcriptional regulator GlxA family with amidase domain [Jatrophihabitans sp. GAS493]